MGISDGMLYGLCSAMVTMGVSVTTVLYASETGMPVWACGMAGAAAAGVCIGGAKVIGNVMDAWSGSSPDSSSVSSKKDSETRAKVSEQERSQVLQQVATSSLQKEVNEELQRKGHLRVKHTVQHGNEKEGNEL